MQMWGMCVPCKLEDIKDKLLHLNPIVTVWLDPNTGRRVNGKVVQLTKAVHRNHFQSLLFPSCIHIRDLLPCHMVVHVIKVTPAGENVAFDWLLAVTASIVKLAHLITRSKKSHEK